MKCDRRYPMPHTMNACCLISDYERRRIVPDRTEKVEQGSVLLWLVCNSYAASVRVANSRIMVRHPDLFENTATPQEIADHVLASVPLNLSTKIPRPKR